jgi:glutamate/tyrosine decarboxylase-like PLP-dependent enzyme
MLVGSAPCFPYGVTDSIAALSDLAQDKNLWLHVDACVGGYIAPFVKMLGEPVVDYNFSIPGVTSMSADLHKYGYAAKGASTVLYRDKEHHAHQVFDFDNWPSGHMFTPTLTGTRPGGAIAAAWAVMGFLGVDGYKQLAKRICDTRKKIADAVTTMGFTVFGAPELSLISFGSQEFDVLAVGEGLYQQGWMSSRTQDPDGIHLMISPEHDQSVNEYLDVLDKLVQEVRSGKRKRASSEISYS